MSGPHARSRRAPPSQEVGTVADALPGAAGQPFGLREGSKGSQAILGAVLHVVARRGREPGHGRAQVLPLQRPTDMSAERLVWPAGQRWPIKQCFRNGRQLFGLGDCEGRSWQGWHHHATLVLLRGPGEAAVQKNSPA